eukprot:1266990-Rhodomonas_salina.1
MPSAPATPDVQPTPPMLVQERQELKKNVAIVGVCVLISQGSAVAESSRHKPEQIAERKEQTSSKATAGSGLTSILAISASRSGPDKTGLESVPHSTRRDRQSIGTTVRKVGTGHRRDYA